MRKVILDTNVLLDYFGVGASRKAQDDATELITLLWQAGDGFLVTPMQLRDLRYILARQFKRAILAEKGALGEADALAAKAFAAASLEVVMGLCVVASQGLADCEIARVMCKTHDDFEDNLIAAVATRIDADLIVTRDESFLKHCPLACLTPADAVSYLKNEGGGLTPSLILGGGANG